MIRTLTGSVVGIALLATMPARAQVLIDTGGFETYALGAVAGQNNWQNDSSASQPVPTIYEDAFTMQGTKPHNKVLKVDPISLSTNDYSGAYLPFGQDLFVSGSEPITISFDQFRGTLNQTAFVLEAPGPRSASSYVGYEYGLDQSFYPTGSVADFGVPLAAGQWQTVNITIDFDKQEVSTDVGGVDPYDPLDPTMHSQNPQHFDLGASGIKQFRGIGFRVYGTNLGTPNGPNYIDNLVVSKGSTVPEPSSVALLLTALGPLALLRRRKA